MGMENYCCVMEINMRVGLKIITLKGRVYTPGKMEKYTMAIFIEG